MEQILDENGKVIGIGMSMDYDEPQSEVIINANEFQYPYCKVTKLGRRHNKTVYVRLDKAKYLQSGDRKQKFTKKEKQLFIEFMNEYDDAGLQRWQIGVIMWNGYAHENPELIPVEISECPDYSKLK